jgi:hypothetical protein
VDLNRSDERAAVRVSALLQGFAGHNILTTNSGIGGVNAVLTLKQVS